jgi:F420-dependent oxidoreductase-like protein
MRIGLMIGSDKERARSDRLPGLVEDVRAADAAGFASMWIPQVPGYLDALTAITVLGSATERIELGTAVVPLQSRHPLSMAQQALTTQLACNGRFTLGLGPSHHWIVTDQLGLTYERPAALVRDYLQVLGAAFAGPGRVDVDNDTFHVHSPIDVADPGPMPILVAALAPLMLKIAGTHATGTILWMADERAVAEHVVPKITAAADAAGRPAPRIVAGVPVVLCRNEDVDAARTFASEMLGHAELSPNYLRLLEHGEANDIGDTMAAGDEATVLARIQRYRDAGVTDFAARVVPFGANAAERIESRRRTHEYLAELVTQV